MENKRTSPAQILMRNGGKQHHGKTHDVFKGSGRKCYAEGGHTTSDEPPMRRGGRRHHAEGEEVSPAMRRGGRRRHHAEGERAYAEGGHAMNMNPYTGHPEYWGWSDIANGVKNAASKVGNVASKVVNSGIGQTALQGLAASPVGQAVSKVGNMAKSAINSAPAQAAMGFAREHIPGAGQAMDKAKEAWNSDLGQGLRKPFGLRRGGRRYRHHAEGDMVGAPTASTPMRRGGRRHHAEGEEVSPPMKRGGRRHHADGSSCYAAGGAGKTRKGFPFT